MLVTENTAMRAVTPLRAGLATTLRKAFRDSGRRSNSVSCDKLQAVIKWGDPSFTQEELDALFNRLTPTSKGCVNFDEFVEFLCSPNELPSEDPPARQMSGAVARYFLSDYLNGGVFSDSDYETVWNKSVLTCVIKHRDTGMQVWQDALDLRPFGKGEPRVLFHYVSESVFAKVVSGVKTPEEHYATLVLEQVSSAQEMLNLLATELEPGDFRSMGRVLLHNYGALDTDPWAEDPQPPGISQQVEAKYGEGSPGGSWAAYCIPLIVPSRISLRTKAPHHASCNLWEIYVDDDPCSPKTAMRLVDSLFETRKLRIEKLRQKEGSSLAALEEIENFACHLNSIDRPADAEPLFRETLQGRRELLGSQDLYTITTMTNLSSVLAAQGRVEDAVPLRSEAVEGLRDALGSEHRETLSSLAELASLKTRLGKHDEAEQLQRDLTNSYRKLLGPHAEETLSAMNGLASSFEAQGKLGDATSIKRKVLEGMQSSLGPFHHNTLSCLNDFGMLLFLQGLANQSTAVFSAALEDSRAQLGAQHQSTLEIASNLAYLLKTQGRFAQAEPLYKEVLASLRERLGSQHAETLQCINNLACVQHNIGKLDESEPLFREVVEGRIQQLGPHDNATLLSVSNLATLLQTLGRFDEAEPLFREVLAGYREQLGGNELDIADSLCNLASVLIDAEKVDEVEQLYKDALEVRLEKLGEGHPASLSNAKMLVRFLKSQGRVEEALEIQAAFQASGGSGNLKAVTEEVTGAG